MIGDILSEPQLLHPLARQNRKGARKAVFETLAVYLLKATFIVDGGTDEDRSFKLNEVSEEWPSGIINYPIASIIEVGSPVYSAFSFKPRPLEETLGVFDCFAKGKQGVPGKTVLWKIGELELDIQCDFWTTYIADREAIEAHIGELFNPSEERTGVVLEGPENYFSQPIRYTLLDIRNDDSAETSGVNERRLRCLLRAENAIVSLKEATYLPAKFTDLRVVDPNDPEE